jgi:small subunit ribosomal protein S20
MPHTRSAKKSLRKSEKRRVHNRAIKRAIKKQLKHFLEVCDNGSVEDLRKEYTITAKRLDKAAAKRVVHPNLAARKKSQLGRLLHQKTTVGQKAPAGQ